MACPWPAPSHYLYQCWIIVNWTLRNKLQWNLNKNSNIFIQENAFESVVCETTAILSRPQCVKKANNLPHGATYKASLLTYWLFQRSGSNFNHVISKHLLQIKIISTSGEIAPRCHRTTLTISQHWFKSWLCRLAISHRLSHCWLRSILIHGITAPQWVKAYKLRPN